MDKDLLVVKRVADLEENNNPKYLLSAVTDGNMRKTDYTVLKSQMVSGVQGEAFTTSSPTAWAPGDPTLFEKWDINTPGVYTNFKKSDTTPVEVTVEDLKNNFVQIWVTNGVSSKILSAKPSTEADSVKIVSAVGNSYENTINFDTLVNDSYIDQTSGVRITVAGFKSTDYIKIVSGKRYVMAPLYKQFAFYDSDFNYIVDNQSAASVSYNGIISIVTPENAAYIRMTLEASGYSNYYLKLNEDIFPMLFNNSTITVKSEGGNFNSIKAAVEYANSTGIKHYIMVANGIWVEELNLTSGIPHAIIGESKESTIITNHSGNLYEPIKVKGGWYFENIQVRNVGRGYAVHADYAGAGIIEFNNCHLETFEHAAIGAGSHQDQTLRLVRCALRNTGVYIGSGLLYWHNNVANGVTNQKLEVLYCDLYSNEEMAVRIEDANLISGPGGGNQASVMFFGNVMYSSIWTENIDLKPPAASGMIAGNSISLAPRSYGNNITILNV